MFTIANFFEIETWRKNAPRNKHHLLAHSKTKVIN